MYMYTYMYMGKNYTLYIKNNSFDKEKNKSGLVNELLAEHYDIHPKVDNLVKIMSSKTKISNTLFCKNGHPIPEGRDKCLGKGCKYA